MNEYIYRDQILGDISKEIDYHKTLGHTLVVNVLRNLRIQLYEGEYTSGVLDKEVATIEAIKELTSEEGESVTICAANPEFSGPDYIIEYNGGHLTEFEQVTFPGETIIDCLEHAVQFKRNEKLK